MSTHDGRRTDLLVIRARTLDAIEELHGLRSTDPAATPALEAVRLTRHTLESFWLPAVDELLQQPP